jgi:hypothetical protein
MGKKGVKMSDEFRENQRQNSLKQWADPNSRIRHCHKTREASKNHSNGQKIRFDDPDARIQQSERCLRRFADTWWYGAVKYNDGPQYCERWTPELKRRVRAWFGHRCVGCGCLQTEKALHVHHVWYNKRLCCDDTPRTLVALCDSCHAKTSACSLEKRVYWSEYYQRIVDEEWGGRCWFSKEEYDVIVERQEAELAMEGVPESMGPGEVGPDSDWRSNLPRV